MAEDLFGRQTVDYAVAELSKAMMDAVNTVMKTEAPGTEERLDELSEATSAVAMRIDALAAQELETARDFVNSVRNLEESLGRGVPQEPQQLDISDRFVEALENAAREVNIDSFSDIAQNQITQAIKNALGDVNIATGGADTQTITPSAATPQEISQAVQQGMSAAYEQQQQVVGPTTDVGQALGMGAGFSILQQGFNRFNQNLQSSLGGGGRGGGGGGAGGAGGPAGAGRWGSMLSKGAGFFMAAASATTMMVRNFSKLLDLEIGQIWPSVQDENRFRIAAREIVFMTEGIGSLNRGIEDAYRTITKEVDAAGVGRAQFQKVWHDNLQRGIPMAKRADEERIKNIDTLLSQTDNLNKSQLKAIQHAAGYQKEEAKFREMQVRRMKNVTTAAGNTARMLNMDMGAVNEQFMDWMFHLGLSANSMSVLGRHMQHIAKTTGLTGTRLQNAMKNADQLANKLKSSAGFTTEAAKRATSLAASMEKYGVSEAANPLLEALINRKEWSKADPAIRGLVGRIAFQASKEFDDQLMLSKIMAGEFYQSQDVADKFFGGFEKEVQSLLKNYQGTLNQVGLGEIDLANMDIKEIDVFMERLRDKARELEDAGLTGQAAGIYDLISTMDVLAEKRFGGMGLGDVSRAAMAVEEAGKTVTDRITKMQEEMASLEARGLKDTQAYAEQAASVLGAETDAYMEIFNMLEQKKKLGLTGEELQKSLERDVAANLGDSFAGQASNLESLANRTLDNIAKQAKAQGYSLEDMLKDRGMDVEEVRKLMLGGEVEFANATLNEVLQEIASRQKAGEDPVTDLMEDLRKINNDANDLLQGILDTLVGHSPLLLKIAFWGAHIAALVGTIAALRMGLGSLKALVGARTAGQILPRAAGAVGGRGAAAATLRAQHALFGNVFGRGGMMSRAFTSVFGRGGMVSRLFGRIFSSSLVTKLTGALSKAAGPLVALTSGIMGGIEAEKMGKDFAQGAGFGALTGGAGTGSMFSGMLGIEKGGAADKAMGVVGAAGYGALTGAAIGSVVPVIGTGIGAAAGAIIGPVVEILKILGEKFEWIDNMTKGLFAPLGAVLEGIWNMVKGVGNILAGIFTLDFGRIGKGLKQVLWDGLVMGVFNLIKAHLWDAPKYFGKAMIGAIKGLGSMLYKTFDWLMKSFGATIDWIQKTILNFPSLILKGLHYLAGIPVRIMDWIISGLEGLKDHDLLGPIIKPLLGMAKAIRGVYAGIQNVFGTLLEKWTQIKNTILDAMAPAIEFLKGGLASLGKAFMMVWDNVLWPVAKFVGGVLLAPLYLLYKALQLVWKVVKPVAMFIGGVLYKALKGILWVVGKLIQGALWPFQKALEGIGWILGKVGDGISIVGDFINGIVQAVLAPFKWLYDKLVGHSIIPDLVNAVVKWFMLLPVKIPLALAKMGLKAIKGIWNLIWQGLKKIPELLGSALEGIGSAISGILGPVASFGGMVWEKVKGVASRFGGAMWNAVEGVGSALKTALFDFPVWIGNQIWEGIKGLGGMLKSLFIDLPAEIAGSVMSGIKDLGGAVWEGATEVGTKLKEGAIWVWDKVTGAADFIWEKITGAATFIWEKITGAIGAFTGAITGAISGVAEKTAEAASWTWDKITGAADWVWDKTTGAASWAWDKTTGAATWAWEKTRDAASFTWDKLTGAAGTMWDKITGAGDWVKDKFTGAVDAVKSTISSAIETMGNIGNWLWENITGGFGDLGAWMYDHTIGPLIEKIREIPVIGQVFESAEAAGEAVKEAVTATKDKVTGADITRNIDATNAAIHTSRTDHFKKMEERVAAISDKKEKVEEAQRLYRNQWTTYRGAKSNLATAQRAVKEDDQWVLPNWAGVDAGYNAAVASRRGASQDVSRENKELWRRYHQLEAAKKELSSAEKAKKALEAEAPKIPMSYTFSPQQQWNMNTRQPMMSYAPYASKAARRGDTTMPSRALLMSSIYAKPTTESKEAVEAAKTTAETMKMGQTKGSIYVHDTHAEKWLIKITEVMAGILNKLDTAFSGKMKTEKAVDITMENTGAFQRGEAKEATAENMAQEIKKWSALVVSDAEEMPKATATVDEGGIVSRFISKIIAAIPKVRSTKEDMTKARELQKVIGGDLDPRLARTKAMQMIPEMKAEFYSVQEAVKEKVREVNQLLASTSKLSTLSKEPAWLTKQVEADRLREEMREAENILKSGKTTTTTTFVEGSFEMNQDVFKSIKEVADNPAHKALSDRMEEAFDNRPKRITPTMENTGAFQRGEAKEATAENMTQEIKKWSALAVKGGDEEQSAQVKRALEVAKVEFRRDIANAFASASSIKERMKSGEITRESGFDALRKIQSEYKNKQQFLELMSKSDKVKEKEGFKEALVFNVKEFTRQTRSQSKSISEQMMSGKISKESGMTQLRSLENKMKERTGIVQSELERISRSSETSLDSAKSAFENRPKTITPTLEEKGAFQRGEAKEATSLNVEQSIKTLPVSLAEMTAMHESLATKATTQAVGALAGGRGIKLNALAGAGGPGGDGGEGGTGVGGAGGVGIGGLLAESFRSVTGFLSNTLTSSGTHLVEALKSKTESLLSALGVTYQEKGAFEKDSIREAFSEGISDRVLSLVKSVEDSRMASILPPVVSEKLTKAMDVFKSFVQQKKAVDLLETGAFDSKSSLPDAMDPQHFVNELKSISDKETSSEKTTAADRQNIIAELSRSMDYERTASEAAEKTAAIFANQMDYKDTLKPMVNTLLTSRTGMEESVERRKYGDEAAANTAVLPSMNEVADYLTKVQAEKLDEMTGVLKEIRDRMSPEAGSTVIGPGSRGTRPMSRPSIKGIAQDNLRGNLDLTWLVTSAGGVTTDGRGGK